MKNRYPTLQEIYLLEQKARRLRAEELARLFRLARETARNFFRVKGMRHA